MAKFGRYDARNKKKNRNKNLSLSKDTKIKSVDNQDKWKRAIKQYNESSKVTSS